MQLFIIVIVIQVTVGIHSVYSKRVHKRQDVKILIDLIKLLDEERNKNYELFDVKELPDCQDVDATRNENNLLKNCILVNLKLLLFGIITEEMHTTGDEAKYGSEWTQE